MLLAAPIAANLLAGVNSNNNTLPLASGAFALSDLDLLFCYSLMYIKSMYLVDYANVGLIFVFQNLFKNIFIDRINQPLSAQLTTLVAARHLRQRAGSLIRV